MEDVRYSFVAEWFDPQASLLKRYHLFFWPDSNTIEMFDLKNHRTFLKRVVYPSVKLDALFIGGCVSVYLRQLKIVDFADTFTRNALKERLARTACILLPEHQCWLGDALDELITAGFALSRLLTVRFSEVEAKSLLLEGETTSTLKEIIAGVGTAFELIAPNAIEKLQSICQSSSLKNWLLIAEHESHYDQFMATCFEHGRPTTAVFDHSTIAVIKPHAVRDGLTGKIVKAITEGGFTITAAELFYLDRPIAEEFLEVYKTVIPQYSALVANLASGASVVLQIHGDDGSIVDTFRQKVGPHDPEIAKHVRPNTIRAVFGIDRINNALHATDIPEDGLLESEFFFKILQDAKS